MIANEAQRGQRAGTQEAHRAIFRDAVAVLETEYARPIRIEEVARRVAASPRQLQRIFEQVGGRGIRSQLARIRMSHAARLLASTDLPVKEVAQRVGYGDPSQFSKAFKRVHGVSPSRMRGTRRAALNGRTPTAIRRIEPSAFR